MLKLAVCDDDKAVCEWLRQKLLYYGETCGESLEIYCYLSENALLETLEENQFDIIFLDIQLEKKQWNTDRGRDSQKTAWQNDTDHLYFHLSGVCNAAFSYPSI